ncbi:MAG: 50S ribosomal protein L24 [Candidatus Aenigmarchaeota archaeon]|nr:50S ribosomal protein L24 [Candidatus Aenigmarchaeota archaeon]
MKSVFSKSWKSSVQPRKQRKYVYNAPAHVKGVFLSAPLSKSLRAEFGTRSVRVVKGDKIKILRGKFAGVSGDVLRVDAKKGKIFIQEASRKKVAGAEIQVPLVPSNVIIIEPETKDSKRMTAFKRKKGKAASSGKPVVKKANVAQAPKEEKAPSKPSEKPVAVSKKE